jgi:hypothetical protein
MGLWTTSQPFEPFQRIGRATSLTPVKDRNQPFGKALFVINADVPLAALWVDPTRDAVSAFVAVRNNANQCIPFQYKQFQQAFAGRVGLQLARKARAWSRSVLAPVDVVVDPTATRV